MGELELEASVAAGNGRRSLPTGWRWVRLRDVIAECQPGFACGARDDAGVIQLRMNNVTTRGDIDLRRFLRVPAPLVELSKFSLRPGDILFNNTNSVELVGKTGLFRGHSEPVVYSNHFTRLRLKPELATSEYVSRWLLSEWQAGTFARTCNRWVGQSAVKNDKLLSMELPLPSLEEQKRIGSLLEKQIHNIERARAAAEAQIATAIKLVAASLRSLFEGHKWPLRAVSEIGKLLPAKSISTDADAEVLAVTTACLTETGFDRRGVKIARMRSADVPQCTLGVGEILIARSNTPDLVGRAAVFPGAAQATVASDLTIRLLCNDLATPQFVAAYLSFLYLSGYWKERAGGASGTMKKITRPQILGLQVPTPAPDEQRKISEHIDKTMGEVLALNSRLLSQAESVKQLPAALLRTAFSGGLSGIGKE